MQKHEKTPKNGIQSDCKKLEDTLLIQTYSNNYILFVAISANLYP